MAAPHEEAPLLRPAPRLRSRGVAAICARALLFVAAATRGTTAPRVGQTGHRRPPNVTAPEASANPNATVGPRVIASPPPQNQSAGEAEHPDYPGPPPPWHPFMPPAAPHPPAPSVAPAPTTYDSPSYAPSLPHPFSPANPTLPPHGNGWVNDDDATPLRRRRRQRHRLPLQRRQRRLRRRNKGRRPRGGRSRGPPATAIAHSTTTARRRCSLFDETRHAGVSAPRW